MELLVILYLALPTLAGLALGAVLAPKTYAVSPWLGALLNLGGFLLYIYVAPYFIDSLCGFWHPAGKEAMLAITLAAAALFAVVEALVLLRQRHRAKHTQASSPFTP